LLKKAASILPTALKIKAAFFIHVQICSCTLIRICQFRRTWFTECYKP